MAISRLYTFVTGNPILAAQVNGELDQLVTEVNKMVKKDGTVTFTGHVKLLDSTPTDPLHAASKGYADGLLANTPLTGTTTAGTINASTVTASANISTPSLGNAASPITLTDDLQWTAAGARSITCSSASTFNIRNNTTAAALEIFTTATLGLTASDAAGVIALQCGASGQIVMFNLPTANPGGANRLWIDTTAARVLKVT